MSGPPSSDAPISPDALDDFAMLEGVGLTARRELLATAARRVLAPGEVLIEQGKRHARMFLLLRGALSVHLDSPTADPVATIEAGETVGELSLLDGSEASAFVVAKEKARLLEVGEDAFWQLTNVSHAFAVNLLVKTAARSYCRRFCTFWLTVALLARSRAAMFDGLTGIHNRRWLDETLSRMVRRHQGERGKLSLSLIDIDHFKSFNDTYGHAAGDHVLTVVASTLSGNLRPTDLVARFGGEEFVIIFPDTDVELAQVAAERVREAISKEKLAMPDGTELPSVTISMGVSQLADGQSVPELLKVADMAMYRAKQAGRNRVMVGAASDLEGA